MLEAIASLCGYLMNFIYGIVQNYGIAIIVFTFLVKIILLPFTIKQQRSLEKAQEIQPLVQELQRKYGQDQQKFAEEYQKLLKSKNMTPMSSMGCSGCIINLIQLPILLGMFYMMVNPLTHIVKIDEATIEQYKEEINLARRTETIAQIKASGDEYTKEELDKLIKDAKEATFVNERYYEIDIIKDRELLKIDNEEDKKLLDIDMDFFGINLCDIAMSNTDNKLLLIIPILSTVFTYLSLYISTLFNKKKGISQPKPEDSDIPMPDMRVMNIMMPVMLGYVAYSVPQGVGLYWATSNMLGIIQMVILRTVFDKGENLKNDNTLKNVKYEVINEKGNKKSNKFVEENKLNDKKIEKSVNNVEEYNANAVVEAEKNEIKNEVIKSYSQKNKGNSKKKGKKSKNKKRK